MRLPRTKKTTALVAGGIILLSTLLAYWTCGTGIRRCCHWMASAAATRQPPQYSAAWPVSESDFDAAQDAVCEELHFFEQIANVSVPGPNEIRISSTESNLRRIFFLKRVGGQWKIVDRLTLAT